MVANASEHLKDTRSAALHLFDIRFTNSALGLCSQRVLDARRRVGDERLERSWRAVLGSQHRTCADDASGTQELCHLRRPESNRQLLCDWQW